VIIDLNLPLREALDEMERLFDSWAGDGVCQLSFCRIELRADSHRPLQFIHHFQNLQFKIAVNPVRSQKLSNLIERLLARLAADEGVESGESEEDLPLAWRLRQRFERGFEEG
jgi:hypothetical protein